MCVFCVYVYVYAVHTFLICLFFNFGFPYLPYIVNTYDSVLLNLEKPFL